MDWGNVGEAGIAVRGGDIGARVGESAGVGNGGAVQPRSIALSAAEQQNNRFECFIVSSIFLVLVSSHILLHLD